MAWFHFCTANHNKIGRATLVDMADWFEAGLLDLGHKVTFSDCYVEPQAINIFWEFFLPGMAEEIAKTGIVYGIVATEIPDGAGFNCRPEPEWKARFDAFREVANRAAFIWTMVESTMPFYSQFCLTAYVKLGFSERLIPDYIDQTPEYDFCFFGLRTPYREEVIRGIRKFAKVEWPETFLSRDDVGKLIGTSKIGLSFKQSERWPIPSPTRLGRLMMAKRGVAAEFVPVATQQGDLVGLCPATSEFSEYTLGILNSDWKRRANEVFETYRSEMPMRDIMQCVLDQTLGGIGPTGLRSQAPAFAKIAAWLGRQRFRSYTDGSVANTRIQIAVQTKDPPVLIGSIGNYNIVHFKDKYVGVPQSLGPIDLTQHDLDEFSYVYDSRKELESELAKIGEDSPEI